MDTLASFSGAARKSGLRHLPRVAALRRPKRQNEVSKRNRKGIRCALDYANREPKID
jgi:hypothetical protein